MPVTKNKNLIMQKTKIYQQLLFSCVIISLLLASCKVYTFHDVTIPADVKTVKINYFDNKARYVNPQLSSQLSDAVQQKISNETRLTRISGDNADYVISGSITGYSVSTAGVSSTSTTSAQASQTNLTVSVHIIFNDALHGKLQEYDISRDFPFNATLTLTQAEPTLLPDIIKNLTDDIFNRIFSNW
jgi:hypothetical protein